MKKLLLIVLLIMGCEINHRNDTPAAPQSTCDFNFTCDIIIDNDNYSCETFLTNIGNTILDSVRFDWTLIVDGTPLPPVNNIRGRSNKKKQLPFSDRNLRNITLKKS